MRTWDRVPIRTAGDFCVYRAVDDNMQYVTVYVPFSASSEGDVERTIMQALDTRAHEAPRERNDDG